MNNVINSVGIIGKTNDPIINNTLPRLVDYLQGKDVKIIVNEAAAKLLTCSTVTPGDFNDIGTLCDIAIVVGGDGSFLTAARNLVDYEIPLIGVNEGRLGFLVDILPDNLFERLDEIFNGNFKIEERSLLHAELFRDGKRISESNAFNDVILHKWNTVRMIEFDTYINDQFVNSQRSDGLIISTPTGSTAYALSGGGPLIHPSMDAILLVPICPHTLSNRPIVVNGESTIVLDIQECFYDHAQMACDGQISIALHDHDKIVITKKNKTLRLIHPADHNHFEILRAKLGWG
ncbi:NAD kinase [hydrothermal vent metagenome]|uniref:NAD kinase n=1 Tax=hydrothermal vent metagenome TaxID=652676 RepID=A0A3B0ZGF7_9ZZZZ